MSGTFRDLKAEVSWKCKRITVRIGNTGCPVGTVDVRDPPDATRLIDEITQTGKLIKGVMRALTPVSEASLSHERSKR